MRTGLLYLPNIPAEDAPDGDGRGGQRRDPALVARAGPRAAGARSGSEHQQVPHWEIGEALQLLDMERGARLAGSMFPLYRGRGRGCCAR